LLAKFAAKALSPSQSLGKRTFATQRALALFSGLAAHAMIPLHQPATAAFGLILATLAHAVGWPFVKGGSQNLSDALARCFWKAAAKSSRAGRFALWKICRRRHIIF